MNAQLCAPFLAAALLLQQPAQAAMRETGKVVPDPVPHDTSFGSSVGLSGDHAVIGAPGRNSTAYFYDCVNRSWKLVNTITNPEGESFGYSAALSGNYAIVGAYSADDYGVCTGAVYFFEKMYGFYWEQKQRLLASDARNDDCFGIDVAMDGPYALVGADQDDDKGSGSGSVYVYTRVAGVWSQTAKLTASDGAAGDQFGRSVAIKGDLAIVGTSGPEKAYIFRRSGESWSEEAILTADAIDYGDRFGSDVAIDGNYALVGAWKDDENGSYSGSAYFFKYAKGRWSQTAKVYADDPQASDYFGQRVAMDGTRAIVAARGDDRPVGYGSVYVYKLDGGSWGRDDVVYPSDGAASFGWSVALSGSRILCGAYISDAAYAYDTGFTESPNGTPYTWIEGYQLNTDWYDHDHDGFPTWQEYITGTDPTLASSRFRIDAVQPESSGCTVSWHPSLSDRLYQVSWSTNLSTGFVPLESGIEYPRNSCTDHMHSNLKHGFYTVEVQLK